MGSRTTTNLFYLSQPFVSDISRLSEKDKNNLLRTLIEDKDLTVHCCDTCGVVQISDSWKSVSSEQRKEVFFYMCGSCKVWTCNECLEIEACKGEETWWCSECPSLVHKKCLAAHPEMYRIIDEEDMEVRCKEHQY